MQLWSLRSPTICSWYWRPRRTDGMALLFFLFQSKSEGLKTRRANGLVWKPTVSRPKKIWCFSLSPKAGKDPFPAQQSGGVPSYLWESQPFCSIQTFSWLDEAHSHSRGESALLSLPIQVLTSSKNILTDTPGITFDQVSGHPVAQRNGRVKLTIATYTSDYLVVKSTLNSHTSFKFILSKN